MSAVFVPGDDGHLARRGRARPRTGRGTAPRSPPSARAARGTAHIRARAPSAARATSTSRSTTCAGGADVGVPAPEIDDGLARPAPAAAATRASSPAKYWAAGLEPFGRACACGGSYERPQPARRSGRARSRAASARPSGSSRRAAAGSRRRTRGTAPARPRRSAGCARTGTRARAGRPPRSSSPSSRRRPVACWPWNLSTVPIRIRSSGICSRRQRTCALYGATTMKSSWRERPLAVARRRTASRAAARSRRATASASSGDACAVPDVLDRRNRIPFPSASDRARRHRRRLEPPLVERLRDERVHLRPHAPGLLEEEAHLRPHRLVVAEQVREHRRVRARRDASPARPAAAGSGRRAGRGSAPPSRPRARRRARTARPRRRTACPRAGRAPRARTATTCRRAAAARRRASSAFVVGALDEPRPRSATSSPLALLQPAERVALPRPRPPRRPRGTCGSPCG